MSKKLPPLISAFLVMILCSPGIGHGEEFEPADFVIEDHAALIPVLEGTRRVRVSYRDRQGNWQVYSLAHLAGDEGQIKLRLPDGWALADVCIEVSMTDPFPYQVYEGQSDFVIESDGTLTGIAQTAGNRAGADFAAAPVDAEVAPPEVQESDLWKWQGRTLYFYNQLRGLQVFDFSNPSNPSLVDSLRMPALGEDMYLHPDGEHLILLAKRWTWDTQSQSSEAVIIRHTSQGLAVIDRVPLEGNSVVESRMVGTHLYVAMRKTRRVESVGANGQPLTQWESGLTVEHTDFTNPAHPVRADALDLFSTEGWWYQAVVSATPEYFIVAPSVYDPNEREYRSTLHLIDIRDQSAPLQIVAATELDGQLKDKFKLQVVDGILTCVTQGGAWGNGLKTVVASYDLQQQTGDGSVRFLDQIILAPQETLFATRFDGDRLYVVTAIQIDPLFVVDISKPDDLRLLGELKIPGWSHYLQPRGDRLLSVGVEDRRVAISQFDVSNPADMPDPLRVYLGDEGDFSWSEANYDEQAIGFFPREGVMIVPFQTFGRNWQDSRTALQILTFTDDSLEKAGVIETDFVARRATLLDESTLVSVSGREVNALDVSDLNSPQLLASMEAAWSVDRIIRHGDYLLQFETAQNSWFFGGASASEAKLRISPVDKPDRVLSRVDLSGSRIVGLEQFGPQIHVLTSDTISEDVAPGEWNSRQVAYQTVINLSNPREPSKVASAAWSVPILHQDYQGRFLDTGRFVWTPRQVEGSFMPRFGMDFRMPGRWWFAPVTEAQILITAIPGFDAPELIADYRIKLDREGPAAGDQDLHGSTTLSAVVEKAGKLFLSFRRSQIITDEVTGRNFYETDHKLRVATFLAGGEISVTPATSVPGTIQGVQETGDDSSFLLFSKSPALREDDNQRTWWSNDLLLQTVAYDGFNAFLIDEVTIENAYHQDVLVVDDRLILPYHHWNGADPGQGLLLCSFDSKGRIDEPTTLPLEFHPSRLVFEDGILFTSGWNSGEQIYWMLDTATLDQAQPVTLETGSRFHADLRHAFLDLERTVAWLPVGSYGVEHLDLAPLFETKSAPRVLGISRQLADQSNWIKFCPGAGHFVQVDDDALGSMSALDLWRYQPTPVISYDSWMARIMGAENDPDFVAPSAGGDLDGDGLTNRMEFALGTHPGAANPDGLRIQSRPSAGWVEVALDLPQGHAGGNWEMQRSDNLSEWRTTSAVEMSASVEQSRRRRITLRFPVSTGDRKEYFRMRLK
jgi:hypothetical protein